MMRRATPPRHHERGQARIHDRLPYVRTGHPGQRAVRLHREPTQEAGGAKVSDVI